MTLPPVPVSAGVPPVPPIAAPPVVAAVLGDVPGLMRSSRPRPLLAQARRVLLTVVVVALLGPVLGAGAGPGFALVAVVLALATAYGLLAFLTTGLRREAAALDQIETLAGQRRTAEAAFALHGLLSRPMHAPDHRLRAILLLGTLLGRMDRPDDAIVVYDELIDTEGLAGPGGATVKLARAMVMLTADHLYDADRAINDLRRLLDRGGVGGELREAHAGVVYDGPDAATLAGLRLLELYRDVKTNHLDEATASFAENLPMLRQGLGHRVADAHALMAIALHRRAQTDEAQVRYADATALQPLNELVRRYPELWPLTQVYTATSPPRS